MNWSGATCRSCGEPIIWAVTEAGRRMPVDREPVLNGNLELSGAPRDLRSRAVKPEADVAAYISHFATCNQPDKWRKK